MEFTFKNPWEIVNIHMDNQRGFLSKFAIYDDSKLIQSTNLKTLETNDINCELRKS